MTVTIQHLRNALLLSFFLGTLLIARAQESTELAVGKPDAIVNLATKEGTQLVKGTWRYSDAHITEVDFKAPGPDLKPSGRAIKTNDYTPKAGPVNFDDSQWEVLDPTTLDSRRSTGRLA